MTTETKDPKPAAPGTPRIKGLAVLNLVAAMKGARPDAASVVPDGLRPYVAGRVLVSSWYPEADHFQLLEILAQWLRQPGKDVWSYLGRKNAEIDLGGIYSAMVLKGRPGATLQRAPKLWNLYRDTGNQRVVDEAAGACRIELRDYAFAGPEMARLTGGYLEEMLRQAGAVEASVVVEADGSDGGVMSWRARWQE